MIQNRAGRQPRRDRPPRLPHLPRPGHRHGGGVLRRRCRRAAHAWRPTRPSGCPATRRPTRTCGPTCWSTPRPTPAPTPSTRATASCRRTPPSPGPSSTPGSTWIGPPPAAIDAMGSKVEAKQLMAAAGVPVLAELDPDSVTAADLPVLVKASAGGGGRGMRVVRELAELAEAVERRERRGRLGVRRPDRLLRAATSRPAGTSRCRSWPTRTARCGRWGSGSARSSAVTRRSSRRRRRRCVDDALRGRAVRRRAARPRRRSTTSARARSSSSPAPDGRFWFLEMNTRLQVEHPVTECVTGLDLVALQLRIAAGERLPADPPPARAATRSRCGSTPRTRRRAGGRRAARCTRFERPRGRAGSTSRRPGLRLDAGVDNGAVVGVHYDPMLAKVIAWAPTRAEAAAGWRRRWRARRCTAWPPTATCWCASCATRRSWPARPTPASSTATASTSSPHRWPAVDDRAAVRAGRRPGRRGERPPPARR